MKIAMRARNPNLYSHKRLKEAAEERGHEVAVEHLAVRRRAVELPAADVVTHRSQSFLSPRPSP